MIRKCQAVFWSGIFLGIPGCAPVPKTIESYDTNQKKIVNLVKKDVPVRRLEYYRNGSLKSEVKLHQNTPNGKFVAYHEKGSKAITGHYKNGQKTGRWEWMTPTGELDSLRTFRQGLLDGVWRTYSNGILMTERFYKRGRMFGKTKEFYQDKHKKAAGNYINDLPHGKWTWWRGDGTRQRKMTFDSGQKHGEVTVWNEKGLKVLDGEFNRDLREGTWKWFRGKRDLDSLVTYSRGIPHGPFKVWHRNKQPAMNGQFSEGLEDGVWRWWNEGGTLDSLKTFNNGFLDGPVEIYYKNGQLASSRMYVNASLHGLAETYFASGKLASKITYEKGEKSGPFEVWTPRGKKEEVGVYKSGKPHGKIRRWYGTGIPSSTASFHDGILHGVMRVYSPSNIIKKEWIFRNGWVLAHFTYFDNGRINRVQLLKDGNTIYERQWNALGVEVTDEVYITGTHKKTDYFPSGFLKYECTYKGEDKHGIEWWFNSYKSLKTLNLFYKGEWLLNREWTEGNPISADSIMVIK